MTIEDIFECVKAEREYQAKKAIDKNWDKDKHLAEYFPLIDNELAEAKQAFGKGGAGRDSVQHELVQVIALATGALETISPRWKDTLLYASRTDDGEDIP